MGDPYDACKGCKEYGDLMQGCGKPKCDECLTAGLNLIRESTGRKLMNRSTGMAIWIFGCVLLWMGWALEWCK